MRLLCIGRHPYLSGHFRRFFEALGLHVASTESLRDAVRLVPAEAPDVALVDYELLATHPMGEWLGDAAAREVPIVAISLTRRPSEMLLDRAVVSGGMYLPTLEADSALALLRRAASRGGVAMPRDAAHPGRGEPRNAPAPANAPPV